LISVHDGAARAFGEEVPEANDRPPKSDDHADDRRCVSDLLRGKLARFSQERLARFLNALDMDVVIQIGPRRAWKEEASVTVERVASFSRAS